MHLSTIRKAATGLMFALGTASLGVSSYALSVAKVGQSEVSLEQVRAMLPELTTQQREALGNNPSALKQAVQAALIQNLLVQKAQSANWREDSRGEQAVRRAVNAALAESYLDAIAAVPASYPQEHEVRVVYEANLQQLMQPRQMRLSQIFIAEPKAADKTLQKTAERKRGAVSKVLGNKPDAEAFAAAAREFSDGENAVKSSGDLGWMTQGQIIPALREALENVADGAVIGPVRLDDGWHWLRCAGIREAVPVAFDQVRAVLAERMRAERIQANRQAYLARLVAENPIAINELALIQLVRTGAAANQGGDASALRFNIAP